MFFTPDVADLSDIFLIRNGEAAVEKYTYSVSEQANTADNCIYNKL